MPDKSNFMSFPRSEAPPEFLQSVVAVFQSNIKTIGTDSLSTGLISDRVLSVIRPGLVALGFAVEEGKKESQKIKMPVLFGEGGRPEKPFEGDAYHSEWRGGLEVEASRASNGDAI